MDISFLLFLQNFREKLNGAYDSFILKFSNISVGYSIVLLTALIYWGISKRIALLIFLSTAVNYMVCGLIKSTCAVYRPWMRSSEIHPVQGSLKGASGYSFPSGHTTGAVSFYGVLSLFGKKWFKILMILSIFVVMFSRLYLGVHTPQDVIVGALLSVAGIYVSLKILSYLQKNPDKDIFVVSIFLLCQTLFLFLIYLKSSSMPMDLPIDPHKDFLSSVCYSAIQYGFFIAWVLERRFISFSVEGTVKQRFLRVLICTIGLAIIVYLGTTYLKTLGVCGKFFNNFLTIFYVVFCGPYLIKKFKI